jgi:hypothetical protein
VKELTLFSIRSTSNELKLIEMFTPTFYQSVNFIVLTIYVDDGIVMIPNLILTHELKTIIEI